MKDISHISENCKECDHSCGGIGKNLLTVEELSPIPAKCFVDEIDLTEGDKKIISNPRRDGALVALIDSLLYEEQIALQRTIAKKEGMEYSTHYLYNEDVWVKTAHYFFTEKHGRAPTADELFNLNEINDPKYRIEYLLLFPHMVKINERATHEKITKLGTFLKKADEVVEENIRRYGFNGACGFFTSVMEIAKELGKTYTPSYTNAIFEPKKTFLQILKNP